MLLSIPRWLGRAVVFTALVAGSTPARAGFGVGPTSPIDPVRFPAVGDQDQVAAADNGTTTLFVWSDTRHGDRDLFAARVSDAGAVLDPSGIELAAGSGNQFEPAVTWDGAHWLVVWTDDANSEGTVRYERVGTDGQPLDPPADLSTAGTTAGHPGVAWNGGLALAVWQEVSSLGGSSRVMGVGISSGGSVLGTAGAVSGGTTDSQPAIAALGANALVAFRSTRSGGGDIYAVRITAALPAGTITRLDANDLLLDNDPEAQDQPAVSAEATSWLVAWRDFRHRTSSGADILAQRVSAAGAKVFNNSVAITTANGDDARPALTFDGSAWLATWTAPAGQLARAVTLGGATPGGIASVSAHAPLAGLGAWGGAPAHAIVAWSETGADGSLDLFARRIETGLSFGLAFPLAGQTPNQTDPSIAFGAGHWMVTWVDDRFGSGARQIRMGVTDSAKFEAPNPATVAFAVPRPGLDQGHPTLVYDGTNFNLFWDESRGGHLAVMGARFTAGGALIDTFTVAGGAWNQYEPTAVAFADGDVVVAWTDSRVGPLERDIWITSYLNGAVHDAARALANVAGEREEHPSIAGLSEFAIMVAYETSTGGLDRAIEATELQRSTFAEPFPSRNVVAGGAGHTFQHPSVVGNGEDLMLTYEEVVFSDGPALHKPFAQRFDNLFGTWYCCPAPADGGSYTPSNPVVGSAGYDYVEMWSTLNGGGPDALVKAIDPYENAVDPGTIRLTSDPIVDTPGAVAQGQGDRLGLTFERALNDASWSGLQLFGGDARDTITGQVILNEFLAHPASDRSEFYELFNTSGRSFFLNGWHLVVNGFPGEVTGCSFVIGARKGGGPSTFGEPCGTIDTHNFLTDSTFVGGFHFDPIEGFLPDRGAVLQVVSPGGVVVDEVGYGFKGGAPVSGAIPIAIAPATKAAHGPVAESPTATGDSLSISTSRIPNGTDTGNNANDFNLTGTTTPNSANTGTTAALGTGLFVTRAYWFPLAAQAVVELFNPSTRDFDFTNWYLSNNNSTQQIGIAGNAWSDIKPQDKRILRGGERGSFTFKMDELSVLYLLGPDFTRYEQLGWSRPDNLSPDMCVTRVPDTGGFHDGFDWFSCGGQDDINTGEVRYTTCSIEAPATDVPPGPVPHALSFAGAWPNPARAGQAAALVFSLPGVTGGSAMPVTLALYDVAGRRVATLVSAMLAPGEHRVPLSGTTLRGRAPRAGSYYAELTVGDRKLRRTVVMLP